MTPRYVTTAAPGGKVRVSCTRGCGTVAVTTDDRGLQRRIALNHERAEHGGGRIPSHASRKLAERSTE